MSDLKKGKRRQFVSLPSQDDITVVEHPNVNDSSSISKVDDQHRPGTDVTSSKSGGAPLDLNPVVEHGRLRRGLSERQVQMIAIAGE
jgi:amino acid permease